jgi:hypothetical protein
MIFVCTSSFEGAKAETALTLASARGKAFTAKVCGGPDIPPAVRFGKKRAEQVSIMNRSMSMLDNDKRWEHLYKLTGRTSTMASPNFVPGGMVRQHQGLHLHS